VERAAHHDRAKRAPLPHEAREVVGAEARETRPQPDVGRVRDLGLQADQVLDRVLDRPPRAREQELAGEQRAVERADAQRFAASRQNCFSPRMVMR
jgi:hypothetical protein